MAKKLASDVAELVSRAEGEAQNLRTPRVKPAPAAERIVEPDARRVYSGDSKPKNPGYAARPANRKVTQQRRRSTFNMIAVLFVSAIAIVLYIGNILTINQLAVEVHRLQTQYDKIMNDNNVLQAEINRKSAWEKIGAAATDRIGLIHATEAPQMIDVDEDKLEEFKDK